jgi:hypothetical protein
MGSALESNAIDHLSQHQHMVAGRVFAHHLALEPGQGLKQQGYPDAARRPLHQSQFVGAGRPTVVSGQL